MGIGDRITEVRKRNGLSQAELAKRSGISQAGISYMAGMELGGAELSCLFR